MRKLHWLVLWMIVVGTALAQNPPTAETPPSQAATDQGNDFSEATVNRVLRQLKDGLEGHNEHRLLSAFDPDQMDGYLAFRDQLEGFFRRYDAIRVFYRIVQTSVDSSKGVALVEMQMEAEPADASSPPVRRDRQVRVEMVRSKKGWKIVALTPADFLAP